MHSEHIYSELSYHHAYFQSTRCQLIVEKVSCKSHPNDDEFPKVILHVNSLTFLFWKAKKQLSLGKLKLVITFSSNMATYYLAVSHKDWELPHS